ncbi:MAG: M14 family metallopeptidase [Cyanobacteriota bacterium]|nr:M14 family metallopeptidase [Cyanobacteriota bacterium]
MPVPPFDFSHYFTYGEIVSFLQEMQAAYPHLMELQVIGHSYQNRDIWLATLTQQATGSALEKPAYWIDANTHAGEVTGSAVALYTIYHLLTTYGQDAHSSQVLDGYTIYVLPRIAVDGSEKYLTTPYLLRSSVRSYPYPEQQDGLYPEDVNGDGQILTMRLVDPCGAWKASAQDPRVMRPREPDDFGGIYYTLLPEGSLKNYDGYGIKLAPDQEGMDFNRNYPHEWAPEGTQVGAGEFPFSEPETRAEAEFWRTHRNINGFLTYHTFSAVILRPYSTHPDEHFPVEDLDTYKLIGAKGSQITGYECVSVYHKFRYHPKEVIRGGMDDYGYDQWGWFGFTTELWDLPTAAGVEKKDYIEWFRTHPEADDLTIIAWADQHLGDQGFHNWQPFQHPQLGSVEIGGWDFKYAWQNAPAAFLPELCQKHCQFTLAHALMSPRLAIGRTEITPQGAGIYHLVVQLENQGFLPTYTSKKAQERKIVRPIRVVLALPDGASLITGHLDQEVGHLEGRSNKYFADYGETDYRCKIEWVIKGSPHAQIQLTAIAERAGTVRATITLP